MIDREKVIKGLEYCAASCKGAWDEENGCPYMSDWTEITLYEHGRNGRCVDLLATDALALLKAQEPRVMTLEEVLAWAEMPAEKREPIFFEQRKGQNGWIANSACPKDYYLYCEDGDARCWTSRPTDAQREAVKWE